MSIEGKIENGLAKIILQDTLKGTSDEELPQALVLMSDYSQAVDILSDQVNRLIGYNVDEWDPRVLELGVAANGINYDVGSLRVAMIDEIERYLAMDQEGRTGYYKRDSQ